MVLKERKKYRLIRYISVKASVIELHWKLIHVMLSDLKMVQTDKKFTGNVMDTFRIMLLTFREVPYCFVSKWPYFHSFTLNHFSLSLSSISHTFLAILFIYSIPSCNIFLRTDLLATTTLVLHAIGFYSNIWEALWSLEGLWKKTYNPTLKKNLWSLPIIC